MTSLSNDYLQSLFTGYIQQNHTRLVDLQEKVSSGKNIQKASDDPLAATRIAELTINLSHNEQYTRNIGSLITALNQVDSSINNVTDAIQRAKELAVQAGNDTLSQGNLNTIASEIDQLTKQIVQIGNTKVGDRYIFAGLTGNTVPYTQTGNQVAFNGTPNSVATSYQTAGEIAPGISIASNVDSSQLFGSVNTTTTAGVESVTGGSGLLRTLTTLKLALQQGDKTTVRSQINALSNNLDTVTGIQADVGARVNRLQQSQSRLTEQKSTLSEAYSDLQDVDIAKATSDLAYQQTLYQASLLVTSKVLQTSLLDYLR